MAVVGGERPVERARLSRESRSFAGRLDLVGLGERLEQRLRIRNLREFQRRRTAFMDQIAGHYRRGRGRSRDGLEAGLWQQVDRFVKLDELFRLKPKGF
jgi:hypothetical protein